MTPETILLGLALLMAIAGWYFAIHFRQRAFTAEAKVAVPVDQMWPNIAARAFPRPKGVPSTERDVERTRQWRERRALGGDHHRRHRCDATNDSEAAREILTQYVGGLEVEE